MSTEYEITRPTETTILVTKHVQYDEEFEFELDKNGHIIVPKCSCGYSIEQNRCPWERGGDCSRHDPMEALTKIRRNDPTTHEFKAVIDHHWLKNVRIDTTLDECRVCHEEEAAHAVVSLHKAK